MRLIFSIAMGAALLCLGSCKSDEERFWEAVVMNENSGSFAFVFTSTTIPFAGDYVAPMIKRMSNNQVPGVDSKNLQIVSLNSSVLDEMYNPNAEQLLFNFDDNGNNTFSNYPAFVNNWEMFNFDTTAFYQSVATKANTAAPIHVGTLIKAKNGELTFYIKLKYAEAYSKKHSVAVYIYEKEKISYQKTTTGEISNYTHRNVLWACVNNSIYGEVITGNKAAEYEAKFEYEHDVTGQNLNNLGFATVVFELGSDDKPIGVVNITSN